MALGLDTHMKMQMNLYLHIYKNPKWTKDLNIRAQTIKLLTEHVSVHRPDPGDWLVSSAA